MTVDARLARRVATVLRVHPGTRGARVAVDVQNGVVLLGGRAGSPLVRRAVGDLARATVGVRDVCNMVSTIQPAGEPAGRESVAEADMEEISYRFERLMSSSFGRSSVQPRARLRAAVMTGAAGAWWLLVILIMAVGWIGAVIVGLSAVVVLQSWRTMRFRRP